MFERYTESARRSLFFARYEASQLGAVSIETDLLLLGLLRDGSVLPLVAPVPLERLTADIKSHRKAGVKIATSVEIPFDAATKRSLQFAAEEADLLLHNHIGAEHLLLGLLREEPSAAAAVLAAHDVRLSDVRRKVQELQGAPARSAQPVAPPALGQIKDLVEQLARAPRDSPEAGELVTRIHAALDALLKD